MNCYVQSEKNLTTSWLSLLLLFGPTEAAAMGHGPCAVLCMHDVGVRYCTFLYGACWRPSVCPSLAPEGCLLIADVICEVPAKEMTILASIITITSTYHPPPSTSTSIYLPPPTHLHPHTLVLTIDHGLRIHNPCHTHISKHSVVLLQLKLL